MAEKSTRSRYDWEKIRAEYEAGASQSDLSRRHGVSRTAIQKRIVSGSWSQDITGAVDRLTAAKVAGVVTGCNPKKKAAALERAATLKAEVIARHKLEWEGHRDLCQKAITESDFDAAKLAKITAETIKIRQEGERRAWGIKDAVQEEGATHTHIINFGERSVDDLMSMTREAFSKAE